VVEDLELRASDGDDAPLVFHELAPPTRADVEAVASRTAAERLRSIQESQTVATERPVGLI
jgi:hypothetical protein